MDMAENIMLPVVAYIPENAWKRWYYTTEKYLSQQNIFFL